MYFDGSNNLPVVPTNKVLQLLVVHLLNFLRKRFERGGNQL